MSQRTPKLFVDDIKESIKKIEKYTKEISEKFFESDEKIIDAVVRNLEIIGEAANKMPAEFKSKHKDIPWKKIVGMRNKVIHEYFGVDWEILWDTIKEDIPKLKKQIN